MVTASSALWAVAAVLLVCVAVVAALRLAGIRVPGVNVMFEGSRATGEARRVPMEIELPGGETLRLAYLSMEDIASLQATHGTEAFLPAPKPHVRLPEGFTPVPWHHLDLQVTLHKAQKAGATMRGWATMPHLVDDRTLSEGIHVLRYVSRADIKALRSDNGCVGEDAQCGQYVWDSSLGRPVVMETTTRDMLKE